MAKDTWGKMQLRGVCFKEIPKEGRDPTRLQAVYLELAVSSHSLPPASERTHPLPPTAILPLAPPLPRPPDSSATQMGFVFNFCCDCTIACPCFLFCLIYPYQCCPFDIETILFILAFNFFITNSYSESWTIKFPKASLCYALLSVDSWPGQVGWMQ